MSDTYPWAYWNNKLSEERDRPEDRGIPHEHIDGHCAICGYSLCQCFPTCAYQTANRDKCTTKVCKCENPVRCNATVPEYWCKCPCREGKSGYEDLKENK